MAKPTDLPRWANVGGDVVEPSAGKQDIGWVAGEKPPAQFFNWLQELNYDWLAWLDTLDYVTDPELAFSGMAFSAVPGGSVLGSGGVVIPGGNSPQATLVLPIGSEIDEINIRLAHDPPSTITIEFHRRVDGVDTTIDSVVSTDSAFQTITMAGIGETIVTDVGYFLKAVVSAGGTSSIITAFRIKIIP